MHRHQTLNMEYRMRNDDKCECVLCFVCRIHDEDHYLAKTIFENEMNNFFNYCFLFLFLHVRGRAGE